MCIERDGNSNECSLYRVDLEEKRVREEKSKKRIDTVKRI